MSHLESMLVRAIAEFLSRLPADTAQSEALAAELATTLRRENLLGIEPQRVRALIEAADLAGQRLPDDADYACAERKSAAALEVEAQFRSEPPVSLRGLVIARLEQRDLDLY